MRKIQLLVASVGAIGLIGGLSACSDDSSNAGNATVDTGGKASVTVDGQPVNTADQVVACTESAGKFVIAVGDATAGASAIGATLTTGDNPEVETVGLGSVNGQTLGYAKGAPGGDATVVKDGKSYTITGHATGIDMANPTAPSKKAFEIKVTCP